MTAGPMGQPAATSPPHGAAEMRRRVEQVLELIRPAVQSDGGDVELVEFTPDGTVKIRLHGACVGCPSASATLQHGIERNLRQHVPGVVSVVSVE